MFLGFLEEMSREPAVRRELEKNTRQKNICKGLGTRQNTAFQHDWRPGFPERDYQKRLLKLGPYVVGPRMSF